MHRFFIKSQNISGGMAFLAGSEAEHLKRVLRLKAGEIVEVFDGQGRCWAALIVNTGDDGVVKLKIIGENKAEAEPSIRITLFQGLPKSDKMDYIVQKTTELGISRIVPIETRNTVFKVRAGRMPGKIERWQRIALEAAKQCGRSVIPDIQEPVLFEEALLQAANTGFCIIPYEKEQAAGLKRMLELMARESRDGIGVFIGPEGGFTVDEVEAAVRAGVKPVTLGPRILRTETAGLAVVSIIMYELGDMGG